MDNKDCLSGRYRSKKNSLILSPIFVLLFLSCLVSATNSHQKTFIHCLVNHSQPSHPITSSIFTPNNPSFSSVLEAYIRNLRFNTSTTRKPYLIITALHVSHIQASIICAKKHKWQRQIFSHKFLLKGYHDRPELCGYCVVHARKIGYIKSRYIQ